MHQSIPAAPSPTSPRATAGHLPALSVPGVGHYLDCSINEKCCSVDGGRGICPLFSSPPRGIWQLKSPHPREFAIQGKKIANPPLIASLTDVQLAEHSKGKNF